METLCSISYFFIIKPMPKKGILNLINSKHGKAKVTSETIITEATIFETHFNIKNSAQQINKVYKNQNEDRIREMLKLWAIKAKYPPP